MDQIDTALRWQQNLGFAPLGLNLDALYDALHGAPSPDDPRLTLVFTNLAALAARDPRRARLLPEVLADRAHKLHGTGMQLQALLTDTPFERD